MEKYVFVFLLFLGAFANVSSQNKVYFNKKYKSTGDSIGASFYREVAIAQNGNAKVSDYTNTGVLLSVGNTSKAAKASSHWDYHKVGQYATFYPSGQVYSSRNYIDDKQNGVALYFDLDGRVAKHEYYKNDRLMAVTILYENGEVEDSMVFTYVKRKVYYQLLSYHPNGTLARLEKYESPDKLLEGQCYDTLGVKCDYIPYLELPRYPGGDAEMNRFIRQNFKNSIDAQVQGVSGNVLVECIIDECGNVKDAKVKRGLSFLLDEEAVRVVMAMPQWSPGKKKGVPVAMTYVVPVRYNVSEVY